MARTCRMPINVSVINDRIRRADRRWHVLDRTGGTFAMLCRFFELEGLIRLGSTRHGVVLE